MNIRKTLLWFVRHRTVILLICFLSLIGVFYYSTHISNVRRERALQALWGKIEAKNKAREQYEQEVDRAKVLLKELAFDKARVVLETAVFSAIKADALLIQSEPVNLSSSIPLSEGERLLWGLYCHQGISPQSDPQAAAFHNFLMEHYRAPDSRWGQIELRRAIGEPLLGQPYKTCDSVDPSASNPASSPTKYSN